jgi:ABC-2 type transport system permease protein
MNLRRTGAVARKEFIHIWRDPRSLIMALAVPLLLLLLFGYALTLDVDRIPTLIYDSDQTPQSRELIERFRGSRYFQIIGTTNDYRTIETQIDQDKCLLALVIPHRYGRNILAGDTAKVQLLLDGSDSNTASIALGYAEALLKTFNFELQSEALEKKGAGIIFMPVETRLRVWYNHELESKNFIVPGLVAVILMIISALLTSLTIAREWEMGTMEQLLSTPLRSTELVLGKMIAFFALGMVDALMAIGIGVLIFRVPLRGSPLLLFTTTCIFLFGALCMGIMISAMARQQLIAYQLGIITSFLPAFLLSGFVFAIENMPKTIQVITHIVPARYFIIILKGIFLKGVGIKVLWLEIVLLLAYAGVVFMVASRKLKQKLV